VGIEDKVIDRGGLTASVVVAPTNDPTQPLSVVQVSDFSHSYKYWRIHNFLLILILTNSR